MNAAISSVFCPACGGKVKDWFQKRSHRYSRCRSCGTLAMVPQPTDAEIEEHYREKFSSGNYELIRRFADQYRSVYAGFLKAVEGAFAADGLRLKGRRILEIGCFTGDFLVLASEAGCDVRGFELQEEAVAIAEERIPGKVSKTDVHDRNVDGSAYDAVCLFGVVEHVRDPAQLIQRAAELLRPGGYVFIQTPDSGSWPARAMGRYWPPVSPIEHINLLTRRGLRCCLSNSGFDIREIRAHVKRLPVEYVFEMMRHFGPEIRALAAPGYALLPRAARNASLPFYVGEMLVTARKTEGRAHGT